MPRPSIINNYEFATTFGTWFIGCGSNSQKPKALNSRIIGKEEFVIIVTTTSKKDPWTRTFNGLFIEPCCDFRRISKSYMTKSNG
jgi:hypothetical protein